MALSLLFKYLYNFLTSYKYLLLNQSNMDNILYYENYIKGLIVKVVKPYASKLIYDVNREKYVVCFKFNENYCRL